MNANDMHNLARPPRRTWHIPAAFVIMGWCAGEVLLNAYRAVWFENGIPHFVAALWWGWLFVCTLALAEYVVNGEGGG